MDTEVSKKIQADFPQSAWTTVEQTLLGYGPPSHHAEVDRVRFDILLLANGDLSEVKRLVNIANQDYRDILYWAEYYEHDPWILWQRLVEHLKKSSCLSASQAQYFLDLKGAGFWREPSLAALKELCDVLEKNSVPLSKDDFEQIRAYGKRWKSKAFWKSLRKQFHR